MGRAKQARPISASGANGVSGAAVGDRVWPWRGYRATTRRIADVDSGAQLWWGEMGSAHVRRAARGREAKTALSATTHRRRPFSSVLPHRPPPHTLLPATAAPSTAPSPASAQARAVTRSCARAWRRPRPQRAPCCCATRVKSTWPPSSVTMGEEEDREKRIACVDRFFCARF